MYYLLCPIFWTVLDEPYYKGLSSNEFLRERIRSNEFLRGKIRKESPFHFLFFYFFEFFFYHIFSVLPFFSFFPLSFSWWSLDVSEGHNNYKGKGGG